MEGYHRLIPTIKEVALNIGERVLNLIVPPESVELIREESLKRATPLYNKDELFGE